MASRGRQDFAHSTSLRAGSADSLPLCGITPAKRLKLSRIAATHIHVCVGPPGWHVETRPSVCAVDADAVFAAAGHPPRCRRQLLVGGVRLATHYRTALVRGRIRPVWTFARPGVRPGFGIRPAVGRIAKGELWHNILVQKLRESRVNSGENEESLTKKFLPRRARMTQRTAAEDVPPGLRFRVDEQGISS